MTTSDNVALIVTFGGVGVVIIVIAVVSLWQNKSRDAQKPPP